jgi:hypothetical protein
MGGDINLTKSLFAGLIILFSIVTIFNFYLPFVAMNNATIDPTYNSFFIQISSQYASLKGVANITSDQTTARDILNLGGTLTSGTINVFVTGLNSLASFFSMIPIFTGFINMLNSVFPGLGGLFSLFIIIIGVYFVMAYIQSASNKFRLP